MSARISMFVFLFSALVAVGAMAAPGAQAVVTPGGLTPTPEPTAVWDESILSATGFCDNGTPTFSITNIGKSMQGSSTYWLTNSRIDIAGCEYLENSEDGGGVVTLTAGQTASVVWPDTEAEPPYSMCLSQRPGYPGEPWLLVTVGKSQACVTAEEVVDEPVVRKGFVFIPRLGK